MLLLWAWLLSHTTCLLGQAQEPVALEGQGQGQCLDDTVPAVAGTAPARSLLQHTSTGQRSNHSELPPLVQATHTADSATSDATAIRQIEFQASGPELGARGQLHSQVGQDWLVASLLGCKTNGYFLDLAANDAQELSNTLMLERDFGWNGICAEANIEYFYKLTKRRCQLFWGAVGDVNESVLFKMNGPLGGIVGENYDNKGSQGAVKMRTVPLAKILDSLGAPSRIDYFSLDVEGAESLVMHDFPFDRYVFSVLTVERPKKDLQDKLEQAGYVYLRKNSFFNDVTYIHRSLPDVDLLALTWENHPGEPLPTSCMTEKNYTTPQTLMP